MRKLAFALAALVLITAPLSVSTATAAKVDCQQRCTQNCTGKPIVCTQNCMAQCTKAHTKSKKKRK